MEKIFEWQPKYNTPTFCDIYPEYDLFLEDMNEWLEVMFPSEEILTENSKQSLFYLLYSKYGETPISGLNVNQWKAKLFSIIGQHGPLWQRKRSIQRSLRNISDEELLIGAKQIYNHAFNPSSKPKTGDLDELEYINDQNTAINKKSKMEAYSILWSLLHSSETEDLLEKCKKCFCRFVGNQHPIIYESED